MWSILIDDDVYARHKLCFRRIIKFNLDSLISHYRIPLKWRLLVIVLSIVLRLDVPRLYLFVAGSRWWPLLSSLDIYLKLLISASPLLSVKYHDTVRVLITIVWQLSELLLDLGAAVFCNFIRYSLKYEILQLANAIGYFILWWRILWLNHLLIIAIIFIFRRTIIKN